MIPRNPSPSTAETDAAIPALRRMAEGRRGRLCVVGLLAVSLWLTGTVGALELLTNGGFESGTGNDADGWTEGVIGGGSTLERIEDAGLGGGYAMVGRVAWVSGTGTKTELRQATAMGSVTPGESYRLSFFARGTLGPGAVAWFELLWINATGAVVGSSGLGNIFASLTENYTEFGGMFTAPASADSVVVSIRLEGGAFAGSAGELAVDAVSLLGNDVDPGPTVALGFDLTREGEILLFRWNGRAGKVYDLRSNTELAGSPAQWPLVFEGLIVIPGAHVEPLPLPSDATRFYVLVERDA